MELHGHGRPRVSRDRRSPFVIFCGGLDGIFEKDEIPKSHPFSKISSVWLRFWKKDEILESHPFPKCHPFYKGISINSTVIPKLHPFPKYRPFGWNFGKGCDFEVSSFSKIPSKRTIFWKRMRKRTTLKSASTCIEHSTVSRNNSNSFACDRRPVTAKVGCSGNV